MVGFELKAVVVILLVISITINFITYKEVWTKRKSILFGIVEIGEGTSPKNRFWYLLLISFILFTFGLYLNDIPPIILF